MVPDKPAASQNPARPPAPETSNVYTFPARVLSDEQSTTAANEARALAHEAGLTPGEFTSIAAQQLDDEQRFHGMSHEQKLTQLHTEMRAVWKDHYDGYVAAVQRLLAENPAWDEKLDKLGMHYNKMALWTLGTIAAAKYGLR
jgi:hypothetical protein